MLGILTGSLPLSTAPNPSCSDDQLTALGPAASGPALLEGTEDIWVLNRHGAGHAFLPHQIPYRENVLALRNKGCTHVLAVYTVGGVGDAMQPGQVVLPRDFLDYTWAREDVIPGAGATHQVCNELVTPAFHSQAMAILAAQGVPAMSAETLAITQGPRYETPAEVRRYARDGADLVGMTAMPEVLLVNQVGMQCVAVALVVNRAAGLASSSEFDQTRIKGYYADFAKTVHGLALALALSLRQPKR